MKRRAELTWDNVYRDLLAAYSTLSDAIADAKALHAIEERKMTTILAAKQAEVDHWKRRAETAEAMLRRTT